MVLIFFPCKIFEAFLYTESLRIATCIINILKRNKYSILYMKRANIYCKVGKL